MNEMRGSGGADNDLRGPFYDALAEGLHAMAQPLTILQGCVLIAARPELAKIATPEILGDMAGEVERMCGLFRCLQDLVGANGEDGRRSEVEVGDMVLSSVKTMRAQIRGAGVSIEASGLEGLPAVWLDGARAKQGWTSLLEAALLAAAGGDGSGVGRVFRRGCVGDDQGRRRQAGDRVGAAVEDDGGEGAAGGGRRRGEICARSVSGAGDLRRRRLKMNRNARRVSAA